MKSAKGIGKKSDKDIKFQTEISTEVQSGFLDKKCNYSHV